MRFVPGINPTRARKQYGTDEINYYDQAAFERDYNHKHGFVEEEIIENIPAGLALQKEMLLLVIQCNWPQWSVMLMQVKYRR